MNKYLEQLGRQSLGGTLGAVMGGSLGGPAGIFVLGTLGTFVGMLSQDDDKTHVVRQDEQSEGSIKPKEAEASLGTKIGYFVDKIK